jgi:hypothetical protein
MPRLYGRGIWGKKRSVKMGRCIAKENLEVHHKNRAAVNSIDTAQVLCQSCHEKTGTYGEEGESPPKFSEATRQEALKRAGNRCECKKPDCHTDENQSINEVLSPGRFHR